MVLVIICFFWKLVNNTCRSLKNNLTRSTNFINKENHLNMYVSMVTLYASRIWRDLKTVPGLPASTKSRDAFEIGIRKKSHIFSITSHSFQFQPKKSISRRTDLSSVRTTSLDLSLWHLLGIFSWGHSSLKVNLWSSTTSWTRHYVQKFKPLGSCR